MASSRSAHPTMPEIQRVALRRSHAERERGGDQHEAAEECPGGHDPEQGGRKQREGRKDQDFN